MKSEDIKIKYLLMGNYALVDKTGKISVMGIFDTINVIGDKDNIFRTLYVVGGLTFPEISEEIKSELMIKILGENFIAVETLDVTLSEGIKNLYFAVKFDTIELQKGNYTIQVYLDGNKITQRADENINITVK